MSNNTEKNAYIKHLHLKGYKSIENMEVSLNNGLNIIIGPNGSGKSNFLEFLEEALLNEGRKIKDKFSFTIEMQEQDNTIKWEQIFEGEYINEFGLGNTPIMKTKIFDDNVEVELEQNALFTRNLILKNINSKLNNLFFPYLINYNYPYPKVGRQVDYEGLTYLDKAGHFKVNRDDKTISLQTAQGFFFLEDNIYLSILEQEVYEFNTIVKHDYLKFFVIDLQLINNLHKYTPIKDLRIDPNINIYENEISNIFIQFYVNDSWVSWNQLSDGTRRLFSIVKAVLGLHSIKRLFLIEEPENALHPDQLYLLMDFLVEQSKDKQIIVTTHSPEVLNILKQDELDRIIITRYDKEKKTQMHHLSMKTKKRVVKYMENEGMLSDCWVHSSYFEKIDIDGNEA